MVVVGWREVELTVLCVACVVGCGVASENVCGTVGCEGPSMGGVGSGCGGEGSGEGGCSCGV